MPTTTPTNQIGAGELENGAKDDETSLNEQRRVHMQSIVPQSKPSSGGDSDEFSDEEENDFGRQFNNELKKRRRTIVNSFRLAELIPTTNTPYSSYRRKSVVLTAQSVVDAKAEEHFVEGLKLSDAEEDYHAILSFNKAISLKPEQIRYYVSRGESYLQTCDFQSAILNYKKACILDPDSDEYYSRLAFLYFFQGQCLFDEKLYSEALESFSRAAEMKPEVIGYHTRSVACLAALQRHGECLALVNKRLEEEIENPDLFIMRARLHELFRNSTLCYYDVKDALALAPENTEAQTLMRTLEKRARDCKQQAVQLLLVGKVKEALTKISIAIETNPSVAEYHVFRGALHRRNFDFNAAIDDYLLAMDKTEHEETHPNYKEAQRQLLLCYNDFAVECFSKGFYDEAVVLLNKAIKGEKREKGLYINRGDCFFHSSELHFAQADYLQALEMDPENQAVKSRLSIVYNEFGILDYYDRHYLESIDHLTAAIRFNPRIAAYYLSRARARYMIEDTDGARNDVLMSAYLDPDNKELLSIFSRLFPGRTLSDVMKSHLGKAAARAVEATIRETYSHQPLAAEAAGIARSSQEASKFSGKAVLPPIFPDLRVCMKEKDFHVNIIRGKKKATKTVKKALNTRQDLRYKGPRVESKIPSLPSASRSRTLKFGSNLEKPLLNPTSKEQKAIFT